MIPNYYGPLNEFNKNFDDDIQSANEIEKNLSPIMLRREVKDVATDLPNKIEIPQAIEMTECEALLYESKRNDYCGKTALNQLKIDLIQGLRVFCSHPIVYDKNLQGVDPATISLKYSRLCEILSEIIKRKEKALIFTSFNEMTNIFLNDLPNRFGVQTKCINGATAPMKRQAIIDEFGKIDGSAIMILNPRATGAGLNITCANHVIHYNLEWNPAVEAQATARAYRRGQENPVFVYRLFYKDTIEEYINNKIEMKQELFDTAVIGNDGEDMEMNYIDVLKYSPIKEGVLSNE